MNKQQVLKELEVFKDIVLREEDHKYLYKGKDIGFKSVSHFKAKYKKDVPWGTIKEKMAVRDNTTVEAITEMWDLNKRIGNGRGTYVHDYIENRGNGIIKEKAYPLTPDVVLELNPERLLDYSKKLDNMIKSADSYLQYLEDIGAIIVAQEVTVFNAEAKISGTFDLLYLDAFGRLHVADYKTDKEFRIPTDRFKGKSKMWGPMENHINCELTIYSLQQHMYVNMIQSNTNLEIATDHIHIIYLNTDNGVFKDYRALDLSHETQEIINIEFEKNFKPEF